ncbi:thioredoxin domain-containing protein [Sphingobacterium sp. SRCM116780]|uniref:thioredoxin domain-containing protein n=1 Tax=Sphingobacterium sp. SRCM116780 TaxID=2907623 RepID=UPI001F478060|nr:thioredoxin domain-containing protein [Sphingobacterium sp. SRCM116780]UIR54925.1 thioredoxin domain-containing protein [Sphingobacterium sp. SRCM116780]
MVNSENKIQSVEDLNLLQFYTKRCQSSMMMKPILETIIQKWLDWLATKQIAVNREQISSSQYHIYDIPNFVVLKNNKDCGKKWECYQQVLSLQCYSY